MWVRIILLCAVLCSLTLPAHAQDDASLEGHWRITVIEQENDPWSAQIHVTATDIDGLYRGQLIATEIVTDTLYWEVEQRCYIGVQGKQIMVRSEIETIHRDPGDELNVSYFPDHFIMRWRDDASLIGQRLDGVRDIEVIWTRQDLGLV